MKEELPKGTESAHLWLAVWITLSLSAYRLTTQSVEPIRRFFERYTDIPLADFMATALFFWLLLLLWIAYRKWRRSEHRQKELEHVISSISPDVLLVVDQSRNIVMCNGAIAAMFGYTEADVVGQKTELLYFDRRVKGEKHEIFNHLERVGFHVGNATGRRKDGTTIPLEIITGQIREGQGVVVLVRDITERKNVEIALRESEERFALFMRHLPAGAFIKDAEGRTLYVNEHFQQAFGRSLPHCIGKRDEDLFTPALAVEFHKEERLSLAEEKVVRGLHDVPQDGEMHAYETYRFPIPRKGQHPLLGGIFVDVTERRRAEEERRRLESQMLQTQKLESLGLLGGGIAHDFNNILAGVLGHADLALTEMPRADLARKHIEEVISASKRAADLCNQLLAYSGEGKFVVEAVDLSALVQEMSQLLDVTISKKAELVYRLGRQLPAVECDVTQLRQVVMNVIVNASDSLGTDPGRITISTAARRCDRVYMAQTYLGENLPEGTYVCFEVADTGCGMDTATRSRIFDPFFTTKFTGRGLGLSAVMGIIRRHRGAIRVESEKGKGTVFTVLLPASAKTVRAPSTDGQEPDKWRGSGTVLVADDEEVIRAVATTMLEKLGFDVVTARDGREAVEVYQRHAGRIRAMLLDLTMPVLGGIEAFNEMRRMGADMPVLLSSGYNKESEILLLGEHAHIGFLQKPYQLETVRRKFKELLGAAGGAPRAPAA